MNKLITYSRYFLSYLKHGDFGSIVASLNFILNRPTHLKDRLIRSSIGQFYCRKRTNDFQDLIASIYKQIVPDGGKVTESGMVYDKEADTLR